MLVLCRYCAPALIIDSIKMAAKLDVAIGSGARLFVLRRRDAESQEGEVLQENGRVKG